MSRSEELAAVAKDWALTIRASQIIPVYPLTEDLQPGDIFLVQTPLEEQVALFESKGFLPLDQHLARLHPTSFAKFYAGSYGIGDKTNIPELWQFPAVPNGNGAVKEIGKDAVASPFPVTDWQKAPLAGFPSYTFSVKKGGGLNLAVPVQGVPIALGLAGSSSATGSITISDAHTYGLDIETLEAALRDWATKNTKLLSNYPPTHDSTTNEDDYFYLRIVTRVYVAGKVNVTLNTDEAFAGSVSGGAAKDVALPTVEPDKTQENLQKTFDRLAKGADAALPGGTLKLATASSRSISMIETFRRPLVVGYLAFDTPIMKGGKIGMGYEPTNSKLFQRKRTPLKVLPAVAWQPDANTTRIEKWIEKTPANEALLLEWLKTKSIAPGMLASIKVASEHADLRAEIVSHFKISE